MQDGVTQFEHGLVWNPTDEVEGCCNNWSRVMAILTEMGSSGSFQEYFIGVIALPHGGGCGGGSDKIKQVK